MKESNGEVVNLEDLLTDADKYQQELQYEEAIECYRKIIGEDPTAIDARINCATALHFAGRHREAIRQLWGILTTAPDNKLARRNLALLLLLTGNFTTGLKLYEYRLHDIMHLLPPGEMLRHLSDHNDLSGKIVLLHSEQGFGDAIQFVRYARELHWRHASVIISCRPELATLFSGVTYIDQVVPHGETVPAFDYQALLLSMPYLCSSTLETIPFNCPYLFAVPGPVEKFPEVSDTDQFKIGIAWSGSRTAKFKQRFCSFSEFFSLFNVAGTCWHSLQVVEESVDAANASRGKLRDHSRELTSFNDTAALISHLDLVITVDSSVAHLAGALGKPVWVLLPYVADWRWFLDRADTPWYPTMRLFRQKSSGDWHDLMIEVRASLEDLLADLQRGFAGSLAEARKLQAAGDHATAILLYRQVMAFSKPIPPVCLNLGSALHEAGRYHEALEQYDIALGISPCFGKAYHNRGNTLLALDRYEEAIDSYQKALTLMPDDIGALVTIGTALEKQGKYDAALSCYHQALCLDPCSAEAHWNLALLLLLHGEYEKGWREFEWRWQKRGYTTTLRQYTQPLWDGSPLHGRRILIHAEQGFGDTVQFVRFLPYVAQSGGEVILECPAPLVRLLKGQLRVNSIIAAGENDPEFDCHLPLLSLPLIFGITRNNIPGEVPYLSAPAELVDYWRERVPVDGTLRVGVVWAGRKHPDPHRSCSLDDLVPLLSLSGATFYSLQFGEEGEQIYSLPAGMRIVDLTEHVRDFADTAAIITHLDLVISIDTAVAHLAGALGKPVFLLLPFAPDWRWGKTDAETPWYPTTQIFRQKRLGQWADVVTNARLILKERLDVFSCPEKMAEVPQTVTSVLRLYCYREGCDFVISLRQKGQLIPLLESLPAGVDLVSDPSVADFFVFPYDLTPLQNVSGFYNTLKFLQELPFYSTHESRHLFFSSHDSSRTFPSRSIFFKTSVSVNSKGLIIPVPFWVEDFADQLTFNPDEIPYATSFVGYPGSSGLRERLLLSVAAETRLREYFNLALKFHYHLTETEKLGRREDYVASLRNSLTVLCPRGDGENSIRFFETLSMGRIPVLISDNCVLPGEGRIPYEEFILRIAESDVDFAGRLIYDWLADQSPEQLIERCRKARKVWEQYFSPSGVAGIMVDELRKLLVDFPQPNTHASFEALYQQGCSAFNDGNYQLAEQILRNASVLAPARIEPLIMLGIVNYSMGDMDRAAELFRQVIDMDSDCIDAYRCLGLLLNEQKRFDTAAEILSRGALLAPNGADIARYLGDSSYGLGRMTDAYHWYKKGLAIEQSDLSGLLNLGVVCEMLNRHDEAEAVLLRAVQADQTDYRPVMNLGAVYQGINRLQDAEACYRRALELAPGQDTALWNLSQIKLLQGDYPEGFKLFESRFSKNDPVAVDLRGLPRWDGEKPDGRTFLVVTEQAFGDTLQFSRFIPLLAAQGATVFLQSHLPLLDSLLESLNGLAGIFRDGDAIPPCDFGVPLLSLPLLLGSRLETLPVKVPYLSPGERAVQYWRDMLAGDPLFRVGIAWKGRDKPDPRRSVPLSSFGRLWRIPGISWYSLQVGEGEGLENRFSRSMNIHDTAIHLTSFDDTAGLMSNLDLIITIDSAVAHLAGALGRRTWVLLPFAPDWRWMLERTDSPWYPTLRLFRQKSPGEWSGVFEEVADALQQFFPYR